RPCRMGRRGSWCEYGMAVGAARAAGASTAEQVFVAATELGDQAMGQVAGVSPGDVASVARLAKRGLAPRPPPSGGNRPELTIVAESASGAGVEFRATHPDGALTPSASHEFAPSAPPSSSEIPT